MFARKFDRKSSIKLYGLESYTVLNYKNNIYLFGGKSFANGMNDKIFKSKTGYLWKEIAPSAPAHASFLEGDGVIFNNKIVLVGGLFNEFASGTVTVDTQPIVGETFTIAGIEYTVVTDGTGVLPGDVDVGSDLADFQANFISALQGIDGHNSDHPLIDNSQFAANVLTITSKIAGEVGNSYDLATTSVQGGNTVSGATLSGGGLTVMDSVVASEDSDGEVWEAGTDLPAAVHKHRCIVYDGKIHQIGGTTDGSTPLQKIYASSNAEEGGGSWAQVGVDVLPVPLMSFSIALWNGRFWVAGGITTGGAYSKKIYSTTDLETDWAEEGTDASPEVQNAVLVPMGTKMYLVGGNTASGPSRKVYETEAGINWVDLGDVLPFGSENRDAFRLIQSNYDKRDASLLIIAGTTLRDEIYESKLDFNPFGWVDVTSQGRWEIVGGNGTWEGDHWLPKDNGGSFDLDLIVKSGSTWWTHKRPSAIKFIISDIGDSPGNLAIDILDASPASIGANADYNGDEGHGEIDLTFVTDDLESITFDLDVTYKVYGIQLYYPETTL